MTGKEIVAEAARRGIDNVAQHRSKHCNPALILRESVEREFAPFAELIEAARELRSIDTDGRYLDLDPTLVDAIRRVVVSLAEVEKDGRWVR